MNWNILPAQTKDAEILSKITKQSKAYWGYTEAQMQIWDEELTVTPQYIEDNYVFKCIVDEITAAYYSLIDLGNDHIKLDNLFIKPSLIKQGLGSLLLGQAISFAQQLEFKVMVLDSDPNATGFYETHGFQIVDEKETDIPGRVMPIMALKI